MSYRHDNAFMCLLGAWGAGDSDGGAMVTRIMATANDTQTAADVTTQLAALRSLTVGELADRYRQLYGEPTRSRNKDYLRKKLAWRIQELAEGGLSERARARIAELAPDAPVRWRTPLPAFPAAIEPAAEANAPPERDPRLPPVGAVIAREHAGVKHAVTVLADGFEYAGERYASLSKIARRITGTAWNGFLFFNLERRTKRAPAATAP